jgi:hypothetical protein
VAHEHVVDIHAVEDAGPVPYLVMQYVAGTSLEERLRRGGPLEIKEVLRIGLQTALGLAAAHAQGLVHRDVKPANILLENGVERVKLTDFGLARTVDDVSVTQSGVVAGRPLYMSPEQARGEAVDHRSDLFSLGSVLYAMCTGRPPFRASSLMAVMRRVCEDTPRPVREVNPDISGWLEAVIARLHAKDPAARYQSAAEVAGVLGQHLARLQQAAVAPPPLPTVAAAAPDVGQGPKQAPAPAARVGAGRKRRLILAASLAGLLLLVAAAGMAVLLRGREAELADAAFDEPAASKGTDRFFGALTRRDKPRTMLTLAGGGPAQAPPELVALLGDSEFVLPGEGLTAWTALSPDGKLLAVPRGETVVLFDARSGSIRRTLAAHAGRVYRVAFAPDSKSLASCNNGDNTVRLWNVATGRRKLGRQLKSG